MSADIQKRAGEIAEGAKLVGPQTVAEIIAAYEHKLAEDNALIAESRAQFERGEILEEELHEGDFLTQRGLWPILLEVRAFGKVIAFYIGASIDTLRERPEVLQEQFIPTAREQLRRRIVEEFLEKREKKAVAAAL
jgi:hypothetical protein